MEGSVDSVSGLLQRWRKSEQGQSVVEFAVVLPVLILLFTVPIDFFRYINTRTLLCSAASESISQISYSSVQNNTLGADAMQLMQKTYGDRVDVGRVKISADSGSVEKKNYTYYVYSSDKANADPDDYWCQFDQRPSSYQCVDVRLQFSYDLTPVTIWGSLFFGDTFSVKTPIYTRSVYAGGYTP